MPIAAPPTPPTIAPGTTPTPVVEPTTAPAPAPSAPPVSARVPGSRPQPAISRATHKIKLRMRSERSRSTLVSRLELGPQALEHGALAAQDLHLGLRPVEPRRAIDFGELGGAARV